MATVILVSSTITSTITQAVLTQGTRYIPGGGTASIYNMVNDFCLSPFEFLAHLLPVNAVNLTKTNWVSSFTSYFNERRNRYPYKLNVHVGEFDVQLYSTDLHLWKL